MVIYKYIKKWFDISTWQFNINYNLYRIFALEKIENEKRCVGWCEKIIESKNDWV